MINARSRDPVDVQRGNRSRFTAQDHTKRTSPLQVEGARRAVSLVPVSGEFHLEFRAEIANSSTYRRISWALDNNRQHQLPSTISTFSARRSCLRDIGDYMNYFHDARLIREYPAIRKIPFAVHMATRYSKLAVDTSLLNLV